MARKRRSKGRRKSAGGGKVRVKGHTRSPRGPDTKNGKRKPTVYVKGYRRKVG